MDQTLDMQVAALIFLAGTKSLVTSADTGDVEMTTEKETDSERNRPRQTISHSTSIPFPILTAFPNLLMSAIYDTTKFKRRIEAEWA